MISANIKSFGYIISSTDSFVGDDFFNIFDFEPSVASKLFNHLADNYTYGVYATDRKNQGFLFFKPTSGAEPFALVKRLDISGNIAATIINERFSDAFVSVSDLPFSTYSEEDYIEIESIINNVKTMLSACAPAVRHSHDILTCANNISSSFGDNAIKLNPDGPLEERDDYIFSSSSLSLMLMFLYMTARGRGASFNISIEGKTVGVLQASITLKDAPTRALEFLQSAMEKQNLSLFYRTDDDTTKILFIPYYIDDGLYGVKAPITFVNL